MSKTGRPFFFHGASKRTQWDPPVEVMRGLPRSPACSGASALTCLATREVTYHAAMRDWFSLAVVQELGRGAEGKTVVDLGCGDGCEASLFVASRAGHYQGWDASMDSLTAFHNKLARQRILCARLDKVDFCEAGDVMPVVAPIGKCALCLSVDAAQYAFFSAAHARRFMRRVASLLDPAGIAVLVLPRAQEVMEKTGNGCIEYLVRGGNVLESAGAAWPADLCTTVVYGARLRTRGRRNGARPPDAAGNWATEEPLVSLPTLKHAAQSANLRVAAYCSAGAFLQWCGLGQAAWDAAEQERRERVTKSCEAFQSAHGAACASDWEALQLWSCAVLVPSASRDLDSRWEHLYKPSL